MCGTREANQERNSMKTKRGDATDDYFDFHFFPVFSCALMFLLRHRNDTEE